MQIGLYFHIPFCTSKCYYCDFLSFPKQELQEDYIDALIREIEQTSETLSSDVSVKSIFIGGGTPTVLPPFLLDRLMRAITEEFVLEPTCEWSIEANPGTLDEKKIEVLKQYPLTRISLGLQSTHESLLRCIGRRHTFEDWKVGIELIRQHTKWAINTDLMFALPNQSLEAFQETVQEVVRQDLEHLSLYALIIEEDTHFGKLYEEGKLQAVSEEVDRQMYHWAQDYLKQHGYVQYEISNWSKPIHQCKHNLLYWHCEPYLGLGLGAHSLFDGQRYYNESDINSYIAKSHHLSDIRHTEEVLTPKALIQEYIFLGLRLNEGIHLQAFEERFGVSIFSLYKEVIDKWMDLKVLCVGEGYLHLSLYGMDVCNEVMASFL